MRITAFIILSLVAFLGPFWLFIVGALFYASWQRGYELIILTFCVDAQFGSSYVVVPYLYTLSAGAIVFVFEAVKPHLTFYESQDTI